MTARPRIVIVDTNVYVRLYCSSVRPILGGEFSGRRLMIVQELYDEFHNNSQLTHAYHWMTTPEVKAEMAESVLKFRGSNAARITAQRKVVEVAARVHLAAHCRAKRIAVRTLSLCDRVALATAAALNCELCTDEWPLAFVAETMDCPRLTSLDAIKLMEDEGRLSADKRRDLVTNWLLLRESLPRGWPKQYQGLFGEEAPGT